MISRYNLVVLTVMVLSLIAAFSVFGGWDHPWVQKINESLLQQKDSRCNQTATSIRGDDADIEKLEQSYNNTTGPKVAFIAYTYMGNVTKFETLVIDALETSMKKEPTFFLVMTLKWKGTFREFCRDARNKRHCKKLTVVWVDCKEGWDLEMACCKAQKGLLQIYEKYGTAFDYFVYQDDDDYLRVDMLKRFLEPLPADEAFTVGSSEPRKLGYSHWDDFYCSEEPGFRYPWGQPVIHSRGALKRVSNGFRLNGFVSECVGYQVLHDVGMQIFNWMYSLPALLITLSDKYTDMYNDQVAEKEEEVFGYHGIQNIHVDDPPDFVTMYQAHEYYQTKLKEPAEFKYKWHNATGYRLTRTFSLFGGPETWEAAWQTNDKRECKPLDDDGEEAWKKKMEEEEEQERQRQKEEGNDRRLRYLIY